MPKWLAVAVASAVACVLTAAADHAKHSLFDLESDLLKSFIRRRSPVRQEPHEDTLTRSLHNYWKKLDSSRSADPRYPLESALAHAEERSTLNLSAATQVSVITYGSNNSQQIILLRPDYKAGKDMSNRKSVWIESGFEANLDLVDSIVLYFVNYMKDNCVEHCEYDYFVVPFINVQGRTYQESAGGNSSWSKTRESFPGETCVGVDLLSNFNTPTWSSGSSEVCSDFYRGPSAMSANQLSYQTKKASTNTNNILFSMTLTLTGSKISKSDYDSPNIKLRSANQRSSAATVDGYLAAAKSRLQSVYGVTFQTGTYNALHGTSHTAHPIDYNINYADSYNFAVLDSTTNSTDPYDHAGSELTKNFLYFSQTLLKMITYYEATPPPTTTPTNTTTAAPNTTITTVTPTNTTTKAPTTMAKNATTTTKAPTTTTNKTITTTKAPTTTAKNATTTTKAPTTTAKNTTTTTKAPTTTTKKTITTTKAPTTTAKNTTTTTKAPTTTTKRTITTTKAPKTTTKKTATTTKAPATTTTTTDSKLTTLEDSLTAYLSQPRGECTDVKCESPPVNSLMSLGMMDAYLRYMDSVHSAGRATPKLARISPLKWGSTSGGNPLQLQVIRPYYKKGVRNARIVKNRPVIWIEAGLEGNHALSTFVAFHILEYLSEHCHMHCQYDYYIAPIINPDGYNFSYVNSDYNWTKTREPIAGSSCVGVNLLENFAHGNWSAADPKPCSNAYRGSAVMSAPETGYQKLKASVRNIALTVTLTKTGQIVSYPYTHTTKAPARVETYKKYVKEFATHAGVYTTGEYSVKHGFAYGSPMDYSEAKYPGYSINVALEGGGYKDSPYHYDPAKMPGYFLHFMKGFHYMVEFAKQNQNLKI